MRGARYATSGLLAALGAELVSLVLYRFAFDLPWSPHPWLLLLLPVLAFSSLSAHADAESVKRLGQLLGSDTITARFSQLTLDGSGTQLQETAGEMSVKRPGLFYWHTDAPQEQLMVSDGQKVSLWDPDLEQVTIKKLDQRLTQTPALLLSGDVSKISDSFDITSKQIGRASCRERV